MKTNLDRWIRGQEAACRRAHDSLPIALRLIRAARGAPDPDAAMQAALDELLGEQAAPPQTAKPAARKRRAAARASETAIEGDPDNPAEDDPGSPDFADSDRAMFLRQDREAAQDERARKKNIERAEGEVYVAEFAPCGDCGHVHNESFCPRCEGDGEEDLFPPE